MSNTVYDQNWNWTNEEEVIWLIRGELEEQHGGEKKTKWNSQLLHRYNDEGCNTVESDANASYGDYDLFL